MFQAFWPVLFFVPFFAFVLFAALKRRSCPECGERLPAFQSPFDRTERQMLWGGWACKNCGCEVDARGRRIDPDVPVRGTGRRIVLLWATLMFGGLIPGVAVFALWAMRSAVAPPPAAPPPVVAPADQ